MDRMRVAGARLNQIPLDWQGNAKRIATLIEEARRDSVQLLCFPELSLTGYSCEDLFLSIHTARQALKALDAVRLLSENMTIIVGLPVYFKGAMFNCAAVVQNQKVLGINPKKVLPREGVHYEARWFKAWPFQKCDSIEILGQTVPFGDFTYQLGTLQLGIVICEEAWSAEGTQSDAALARCELVVNLSASHFAFGKSRTRETLVCDASRAFQSYYLYTNLLGLESGRMIYDGDLLLGAAGKIQARAERFAIQEGGLLTADIDLDLARVAKLAQRSLIDQGGTPGGSAATSARGSSLAPLPSPLPPIAKRSLGIESDPFVNREQEFLQAEKLGLFDYVRKSGAKGFMISLSGGCDSSAVAVLCAHTIAEALRELGPEQLALRTSWSIPASQPEDPRSWIAERVHTVYQSTAQSGSVTREAAAQLARALGTHHAEVSVQEIVSAYLTRAETMMGRPLSWKEDDLSLQNVQARARAPMIWMLANLQGFLLLSTSNRSEVALGYATMDGDTAGGLSPLAGIDKHFLRQWLVWAEKSCPYGLGPLPALRLVNEQEPTAELRPAQEGQKDEIDLMPYEILNTIEKAFIRDRMEPESILAYLRQSFGDHSEAELSTYLARFYRLWSRNQWKRERYAPGFHLDDYSLDPKSWCRYPILSAEIKIFN